MKPSPLRYFLDSSAPRRRTQRVLQYGCWRRHQSKHVERLTMSYVEGATHPPLRTDTLSYFFKTELLEKLPSRPALIARKERPRAHGGPQQANLGRNDCLAWSFEEFGVHIEKLAYGLLSMGVKAGDRVGVVSGNNSAYASLQWACARIGAILVTINPAYRTNELISALKLVGVSTLVVVPRIRTSNYLQSLVEAIPALATCRATDIAIEEIPELRRVLLVNDTEPGSEGAAEVEKMENNIRCAIDFREAFLWNEGSQERKTVEDIQRRTQCDDIVNLQFTSGTTGAPKAVSLTHRNLLNNGISIGRCMSLTHEDVVSRLVLGNLAAWTHGSAIVYPSPIFHPPSIVEAVIQENCSALHGVPTHFLGVLSEVAKRRETGEINGEGKIGQLRTGIAAGSPVPDELMRRLMREMGLSGLTNAYGMTETSPVSFQTVPDDPFSKRTDTVGRVQPHVRAKLIDANGSIVPIDTPGEICVSGYLIQKGYWNDEKQSKSGMNVHEDGHLWMHTGDIGVLDSEGYLKVVGRHKDVIIRGGENLFPVQIENHLTCHPSIREAAAVAVPDKTYGEVVGVFIVREPRPRENTQGLGSELTPRNVRDWVAKGMNPQNSPNYVWFMGEDGVSEELPKTASGKVQKHVLRSWVPKLLEKSRDSLM